MVHMPLPTGRRAPPCRILRGAWRRAGAPRRRRCAALVPAAACRDVHHPQVRVRGRRLPAARRLGHRLRQRRRAGAGGAARRAAAARSHGAARSQRRPGVLPGTRRVGAQSVSLSRREGRRYVHLRLEVDDIRRLGELPPFAWSRYRFVDRGGLWVFTQELTAAAGKDVGDVGWQGDELVAVRLHLPSRMPVPQRAGRTVERGNILVLRTAARRAGQGRAAGHRGAHGDRVDPARRWRCSGMTVLALAALALFIWWVMRRGRDDDPTARRGQSAGPEAA